MPPAPPPVQTLAADFVFTMDKANRVIAEGAVAISDGEILAVGPKGEIEARYPEAGRRTLRGVALMPGLVNAHCHSGILRGTAEGLPVWEWLQVFIDPMHRVLSAEEAEIASRLCYAEALLSGTTTLVDMWRYMDGSARAARQLRNRVVLVPYVGEHPDFDYFDRLDHNEALIEAWGNDPEARIFPWVGLEHLFYADEAGQRRAIDMARKHRTGFHTHSNEARPELVEMARRYGGLRPIEVLERLGFLELDTVHLAHCVWLDDREIGLIAEHGVGVSHNPISNMKLACGAAPVLKLLDAGVAVGLGTDGEKENNNFDLFEEMKVASLLAKVTALDAAALDAWQVLRMATIDGARAIGLDHLIGSLEPGKKADIIGIRLDTPRATPLVTGKLFNLHHNLVHAIQGQDVVLTMVGGETVVDGGRLLTGDIPEILAEANRAAGLLFARREAWLARNANATVTAIGD